METKIVGNSIELDYCECGNPSNKVWESNQGRFEEQPCHPSCLVPQMVKQFNKIDKEIRSFNHEVDNDCVIIKGDNR